MGRLIDADELKRYIDDCDFCDRCPDASPRCQIDCEMPDFLTKRWKRVIDAQPTVDAQAEIDRLNRQIKSYEGTLNKVMKMIEAVKPIRCKDCKHLKPISENFGRCRIHYEKNHEQRMVMINKYCSWAERKDNATDRMDNQP